MSDDFFPAVVGFVYFSKLRHVYLISSRNGERRNIAQSSFSTTIFHARFAYPPDDILRKAIPGLSLRTLMTVSRKGLVGTQTFAIVSLQQIPSADVRSGGFNELKTKSRVPRISEYNWKRNIAAIFFIKIFPR